MRAGVLVTHLWVVGVSSATVTPRQNPKVTHRLACRAATTNRLCRLPSSQNSAVRIVAFRERASAISAAWSGP